MITAIIATIVNGFNCEFAIVQYLTCFYATKFYIFRILVPTQC